MDDTNDQAMAGSHSSMKRKAIGMVACTAAVACVVASVYYLSHVATGSVHRGLAQRAEWKTILAAEVPGHGVVSFREGWVSSELTYLYCLQWRRPDIVNNYAIWIGGNALDRRIELHASEDYSRIWLVAKGVGEVDTITGSYNKRDDLVIASLDMRNERCVGENGVLLDPLLPLEEQEQAGSRVGQPGHPDWATARSGLVLAEWKKPQSLDE